MDFNSIYNENDGKSDYEKMKAIRSAYEKDAANYGIKVKYYHSPIDRMCDQFENGELFNDSEKDEISKVIGYCITKAFGFSSRPSIEEDDLESGCMFDMDDLASDFYMTIGIDEASYGKYVLKVKDYTNDKYINLFKIEFDTLVGVRDWSSDGNLITYILKNLPAALKNLNIEDFRYHVRDGYDNAEDWIKEIAYDEEHFRYYSETIKSLYEKGLIDHLITKEEITAEPENNQ